MIVALYKEQADAAERAAEENGSVIPTAEAHAGLAESWPDYPWAVVVPKQLPGDDCAERAGVEHMVSPAT
jgi:hypothetical protein